MILLYFSVYILLPSSLVLFTNGQETSLREAMPNSMVYLNMLQALQKAILDVYQDSTRSTNTQTLELPKMDTKQYDEVARKIKEFNNFGISELDTYNGNAFKQTTIPSLSSVMNTPPNLGSFVPTVFSSGKIGVEPLGNVAPQYNTLLSTYPNTYSTLPQIPQYGSGAMPVNMGLYGMNQFGDAGLYGNNNVDMGFVNSYSADNLQSFGNHFNSPAHNYENYPSYGNSGNTPIGGNNYGPMYTPREFLSAPLAGPVREPLSAASELSPSYPEPPRYGKPLWSSSSRYNRGQRAAIYEQSAPFRHTSLVPARANVRTRVRLLPSNNLHNVKRIKSRYAPLYQASKEKLSSKPKYLIIKSTS